jgi:hypothetical protein
MPNNFAEDLSIAEESSLETKDISSQLRKIKMRKNETT